MKTIFQLLFTILIFFQSIKAQVILSADGPGNTYELINAVLANPNRNVVEVPDCNHTNFGKHIDEVFDTELNKNVFRFFMHVEPDDDRCRNFDRQRNEIKTYGDSPENLIARKGETVEYKWKMKLSDDIKVSPNFTHVHQIKSVGGTFESIPMISLTLRKSSPDRLELRYTSTNDQNTIKTANLDLLRGNWVEIKERIIYKEVGSYSIEIKNIATNQTILSYSNNAIDMWQDGADFTRPKWGIYRSLINQQDLKDEIVKFADFSIEELTGSLSTEDLNFISDDILVFPNPTSREVEFKNINLDNFDTLELYSIDGKKISTKNRYKNNKLVLLGLGKGVYFIKIKKQKETLKVLKLLFN